MLPLSPNHEAGLSRERLPILAVNVRAERRLLWHGKASLRLGDMSLMWKWASFRSNPCLTVTSAVFFPTTPRSPPRVSRKFSCGRDRRAGLFPAKEGDKMRRRREATRRLPIRHGHGTGRHHPATRVACSRLRFPHSRSFQPQCRVICFVQPAPATSSGSRTDRRL